MIRIAAVALITLALWVGAQAQFFNPPIFMPKAGVAAGIGAVTDQLSASNTGTSSLTLTPTANIAAGSLIVICTFENDSSAGTPNVTDNASSPNTYIQSTSISPNNSPTNGTLYIWYVLSANAVTTANTITFHKVGTGGSTMAAISSTYTGTLSVDVNATPTTGTATPVKIPAGSGTVTPAVTDLFVACAGIKPRGVGDTFTQSSGWSTGPDAVSISGGTAGQIGGHVISSSPQQYNAAITSHNWGAVLLAFKAL